MFSCIISYLWTWDETQDLIVTKYAENVVGQMSREELSDI